MATCSCREIGKCVLILSSHMSIYLLWGFITEEEEQYRYQRTINSLCHTLKTRMDIIE